MFNLTPDVVHKYNRFSNIFFEEKLKFVPSKESDFVIFNLNFILLPVKIDFIPEEGCKKDAFFIFSFNGFQMNLALSIEIITFHIQVSKI